MSSGIETKAATTSRSITGQSNAQRCGIGERAWY